MNTLSVKLCVFAGLVASLAGNGVANSALPGDTGAEAVKKVFARHSEGKKAIWPMGNYLTYTRIRPLDRSTFVSLRKYFSSRQQANVDQYFHALSNLITARNHLAKKLDIHEKWWPIGIDLLKVDAVLTQDLLTGRSDNPDKMTVSAPTVFDGKREVTVQETYTEHGQDRVLGHGHRASVVTLIPENGRWVIDEIRTTTTDAYGETTSGTLTERLRRALKPLITAEHQIRELPQRLEIRKAVKPNN